MYNIDEIENGTFIRTWSVASLEEAISDIKTLKVSGAGHTFSIEKNGVVVDVVKMPHKTPSRFYE